MKRREASNAALGAALNVNDGVDLVKRLVVLSGSVAAILSLVGCGGGGDPSADAPLLQAMKQRHHPTPAPTPAPTTTPAPTPAPSSVPSDIVVGTYATTLLQTGLDSSAYWIEDGEWGAANLVRGTYDNATQYEQYVGVSHKMGPNGEIAWRMKWAWPQGTTEVKSYPSAVFGAKPGWSNTWTTPGGYSIQLLDGTTSGVYPSGITPGTFLPKQLPLQPIYSSFNYQHLSPATGVGHLSYDLWLQSTPNQAHGFTASSITHEIMIPLNYWGNYGAYKYRNPGWYDHDVVLDGNLFHVYCAKGADGSLGYTFGGLDGTYGRTGWKFIVFEPDSATSIAPGTLNLSTFINYLTSKKDVLGTQWAVGNEYLVSVELGVEPVQGTGDLVVSNYRVWQAGSTPAPTPAPTSTPAPTPAPVVTPGNVLVNGDFSTGMTGWNNWGNAAVVGGTLQVGTAAGGAAQNVYATLVPGVKYQLTATASITAAAEGVFVGVKLYDATGAQLLDQTQVVSAQVPTNVNLTFVAPAGAAGGYVYVWKNDNVAVGLVDNFVLKAI